MGSDPPLTPFHSKFIFICYPFIMSRPLRNFKANSFYHIYNRGNNKEPILKNSDDKKLFVSLLYKFKKSCEIDIVIYCIMNNHFHLIVRTGNNPSTLSKFMQKVTTSFAVLINRRYQRVGHIFQGRFNANYLPYKKDLKRTTVYITRNPVQDGIVRKAEDYKWTSRKGGQTWDRPFIRS